MTRALGIMLRPLVRWWLGRGQVLQGFVDVLKRILVDVAQEELARVGSKPTIARISVMTGVHRKDVSKLLSDQPVQSASGSNIAMRVLNQWEQEPAFQTAAGKPKALRFQGDDSEFSTLVRSVNSSLKPGTILFELERLGVVKKSDRGVQLIQDYQPLSRDPEQATELMARNIGTLIRASRENVETPGDAVNLHIRTEYDNVFRDDLPTIRKWFLEEGKAFHRRARAFLSRFDKDINEQPGKEAGARVALVAYSLIEDEPV
ncbi:MAG: hypothetical protein KDD44_05220 [Bdellovibrionales bacterium]|nr:hypothetical protein [Bdellovibrionales bacterium]